MNYNEFEWNLCNRVYTMAVLFPNEYNGVRTLVIQDWNHEVIMIASNKTENIIRVSFADHQEVYESYDDAYKGILQHRMGQLFHNT